MECLPSDSPVKLVSLLTDDPDISWGALLANSCHLRPLPPCKNGHLPCLPTISKSSSSNEPCKSSIAESIEHVKDSMRLQGQELQAIAWEVLTNELPDSVKELVLPLLIALRRPCQRARRRCRSR